SSPDILPTQSPLAYGFLGAYLFSIGSLIRQYMTDDLQLRYYASMFSRYLVVIVLCWMVHLLVATSSDGALIAAFVIGLFPAIGLSVAQRLGTALLGVTVGGGFKEKLPLSNLDGLNAYDEDR